MPSSRTPPPRVRSVSACPPAPSVASTKKPPRSGRSPSATSRRRTGTCAGFSRVDVSPSPSRQQLRELVVVLGREVLARKARRKRAAIGHDQVIDVPRHDDVGRQPRRVAQDLRNQNASLPIERSVLAEVVDALEKLPLGAVNRRQRRELLLERLPDRQRIDEDFAVVQRGHEKLRTEGFLDLLSKERRNLQATLLVETGRRTSPKPIHPSFRVPIGKSGPLSPTFFQIRPLRAM